jgi:hypothetical protein
VQERQGLAACCCCCCPQSYRLSMIKVMPSAVPMVSGVTMLLLLVLVVEAC